MGTLTDEYIKKYSRGNIFVESGTYMGETIEQVLRLNLFDKIYSVELNEPLWKLSSSKFTNNQDQVTIYLGDTFEFFPKIIDANKSERITFWLDGHASGPLIGGKAGGCPLLSELDTIKNSDLNTHTIFIDDRRLFGSTEWDYVTEKSVIDKVLSINSNYIITYLDGTIPNDIICAYIYD